MASDIKSDPAPEGSRSGSDMPESSTHRRPVMIICDLPEGAMEKLQQIFGVQINPRMLGQEDTPGGYPRKSPQEDGGVGGAATLPSWVVNKFVVSLLLQKCNDLLKMVDEYPAQLFLQTFCEEFSWSTLHVAVLKSSETLTRLLMEKLKQVAQHGGKDSQSVVQAFMLKHDEFGLSAAHMAAIIGNEKILSHFPRSFILSQFPEFFFQWHVLDVGPNPVMFRRSLISEDERKNLLEEASPLLDKPAPASSFRRTGREWLDGEGVDFVYCLHLIGESWERERSLEFVKHVCDTGDSSFLEPLLDVRDERGRSPLHVCTYGYSYESVLDIIPFFEMMVAHFPNLNLNMRDFMGRTPLHWAAAQGFVNVVTFLANHEGTNLNATYRNLYAHTEEQKGTNFIVGDDVVDVTPLHLAVIHNHVEVVKTLLKVPEGVLEGRGLNVSAICIRWVNILDGFPYDETWTPFQLAAYMGHERILQEFLKDPRLYDPGLKKGKGNAPVRQNMIPALHLAASQFHVLTVKALVDSKRMDVLVKDVDENTALHYAARHADGKSRVYANIHDYVTVHHFSSKPPKPKKPSDHDVITCTDILMQSGLDMEQKNKDGNTPSLHSSCPENVQKWWLEKMAKEAQENKNNLVTAANAISVTAALVATASFVGPLQPPLGLLNDGNSTWLDGYSQVKHTSVEIFLFFDSLSFYFAIAAIVFAMLPSWPIPHEGLAQEVRIARRCVQVAVLLLFGSIIFVICAFSAASIAIVPQERWRYKTIVVISTSLGVLICSLILFLSFMRLLTLISSKNDIAKKISNVATSIMLWERDTSFAK